MYNLDLLLLQPFLMELVKLMWRDNLSGMRIANNSGTVYCVTRERIFRELIFMRLFSVRVVRTQSTIKLCHEMQVVHEIFFSTMYKLANNCC